jgi:hypothetical protein
MREAVLLLKRRRARQLLGCIIVTSGELHLEEKETMDKNDAGSIQVGTIVDEGLSRRYSTIWRNFGYAAND